ncbi:MAG: AbrB family transcriptional regulator [Verrucomicrobiaceae bacterium]|nr:MAG: AbrB family transcriptional regulator [Verrucomicrobiaceae bacterium]
MTTSTLSGKGQTTIPIDIQRALDLKPGDKIQYFIEADGRVSLLPRSLSLKILGRVLPKPSRTVSVAEMAEAVRQNAARNFGKSSGK